MASIFKVSVAICMVVAASTVATAQQLNLEMKDAIAGAWASANGINFTRHSFENYALETGKRSLLQPNEPFGWGHGLPISTDTLGATARDAHLRREAHRLNSSRFTGTAPSRY